METLINLLFDLEPSKEQIGNGPLTYLGIADFPISNVFLYMNETLVKMLTTVNKNAKRPDMT
jgi:hypothetical protein